MTFAKATKKQAKLRLCLQGASGCGKTYTALSIATKLGEKVAVLDTEHGSASLYADAFAFDTCEVIGDYNPQRCIDTIADAAKAGYDVLVIDSLTHFWNGTGGFLELVDAEVKRMAARGNKADSFAAWKNVTPVYNKLVQAILSAPLHVIVCVRAKQEYSKETENGRGVVKKMGMAPEMRDGFAYEMSIEGMLDSENNLSIGKTRCAALTGKVFHKAGKDLADILKTWLTDGAPVPMQNPPTIAGPNPDIARPVKTEWNADQLKEAGALRAEIEKHPGGAERFRNMWASSKQDAASDVIDRLALLLRQLNDVADEAAQPANG
jgi:KaiC/GvpD/RAD55 family RecA-like ATPase